MVPLKPDGEEHSLEDSSAWSYPWLWKRSKHLSGKGRKRNRNNQHQAAWASSLPLLSYRRQPMKIEYSLMTGNRHRLRKRSRLRRGSSRRGVPRHGFSGDPFATATWRGRTMRRMQIPISSTQILPRLPASWMRTASLSICFHLDCLGLPDGGKPAAQVGVRLMTGNRHRLRKRSRLRPIGGSQ